MSALIKSNYATFCSEKHQKYFQTKRKTKKVTIFSKKETKNLINKMNGNYIQENFLKQDYFLKKINNNSSYFYRKKTLKFKKLNRVIKSSEKIKKIKHHNPREQMKNGRKNSFSKSNFLSQYKHRNHFQKSIPSKYKLISTKKRCFIYCMKKLSQYLNSMKKILFLYKKIYSLKGIQLTPVLKINKNIVNNYNKCNFIKMSILNKLKQQLQQLKFQLSLIYIQLYQYQLNFINSTIIINNGNLN